MKSPAFICATVIVAAILALSACDSEETAQLEPVRAPCDIELTAATAGIAAPQEEKPFYPLEVGNRWVYRRELWRQIVIVGEDPPAPDFATVTTERELIGYEEIDGVSYVVEEERTTGGALPATQVRWWRFRQDDTGLYRRIADPTVPPLPAPADWSQLPPYLQNSLAQHEARWTAAKRALAQAESATEDRRIGYPLEAGKTWITRPDVTGLLSTVEAMETLDLEVGRVEGWRIRFEPNGFTEEDTLRTWTGTCGDLKSLTHIVTHAMDPGTGQEATITSREVRVLVELDLAGRE